MRAPSPYDPRHWPGWLTVGLLSLLARLPRRAGLAAGAGGGLLLYAVLRRRRRIAAINLARCFPGKSDAERRALERRLFGNLGRTLIESAWAWSLTDVERLPPVEIEGFERLVAARSAGRGVLLVTGHFTSLEIGGRLLSERLRLSGVYRPFRDPVLEWWQNCGRGRYTGRMIPKNDFRAARRALAAGEVLWYAPDQDFGAGRSRFVPFFGHPAATLKATWTLARAAGAVVLSMAVRRRDDGSYRVTISGPLKVGGEPEPFLAAVNSELERAIREDPAQYWWVHRRFKTRPPGERDWY